MAINLKISLEIDLEKPWLSAKLLAFSPGEPAPGGSGLLLVVTP